MIRSERDDARLVVPRLEPEPAPLAPIATVTPPPPAPSAPASDRSAPQSSPSSTRVAAFVAGGLGVVALVASGYFALAARSRYASRSTHCNADNACDSEGLTLIDQAKSKARLGTIFGVVGLVGVAAGVTLYVGSGKREGTALYLLPVLADAGGGVSARASW